MDKIEMTIGEEVFIQTVLHDKRHSKLQFDTMLGNDIQYLDALVNHISIMFESVLAEDKIAAYNALIKITNIAITYGERIVNNEDIT